MGAAIGQRESHQQCFDAEDDAELRDNRDAAALAYERDVAIESLAQGALGCFAELRVRVSEIPRATMAGRNFHRDAFRKILA